MELTQEQREHGALVVMNEHFEGMLRAAAVAELPPGKFIDFYLSRAALFGMKLELSAEQMSRAMALHMDAVIEQHKKHAKPLIHLVTE
jgi:hypothetical protein